MGGSGGHRASMGAGIGGLVWGVTTGLVEQPELSIREMTSGDSISSLRIFHDLDHFRFLGHDAYTRTLVVFRDFGILPGDGLGLIESTLQALCQSRLMLLRAGVTAMSTTS